MWQRELADAEKQAAPATVEVVQQLDIVEAVELAPLAMVRQLELADAEELAESALAGVEKRSAQAV